jgi:hypothetical protein
MGASDGGRQNKMISQPAFQPASQPASQRGSKQARKHNNIGNNDGGASSPAQFLLKISDNSCKPTI